MRNFKIIASKANIYTGQVKKLKEQLELPTQVVYIEDLLEDERYMQLNDGRIAVLNY